MDYDVLTSPPLRFLQSILKKNSTLHDSSSSFFFFLQELISRPNSSSLRHHCNKISSNSLNMAVYYPSNVNCYQQEPIYLNHHHHQQQQQPSSTSSSAAAASFVGGEENVRNEMVFIPPTGLQNLNGDVPVSSSELTFRDGQGLSLSLLGTQISLPSFHYHHQYPSISVKETPPFSKEMLLLGQSDPSSGYAGVYNSYNMSSVLRSRYLKPAQGLLDEVVSVEKEMNQLRKKKKGEDFNNSAKETEGGGGIGGEISIELSTIERQELQSKKDKLLTMLDEVVI